MLKENPFPICGGYLKGRVMNDENEFTGGGGRSVKGGALNCSAFEGITIFMQKFSLIER